MATMTVMRTSPTGRKHLRLSEGLRLKAYKCSANVDTIGYGHASTNPRKVRGVLNGEFYEGRTCPGLTITDVEAERLFAEDVEEVEMEISSVVKQDLSAHQMDALVSWWYVFGKNNFTGSGLERCINLNPEHSDIPYQFSRWHNSGGRPDKGVTMRRLREGLMWKGLPVHPALWSSSKFPFRVGDDNEIDWTVTPTIDEFIRHAESGAPIDKLEEPIKDTIEKSPSRNPETVPREAEEAVIVPPAQPSPPSVPPKPPELPPQLSETKDMVQSRRFWGMVVTAVSTFNFLPSGVAEFLSKGDNRELLTWIAFGAMGLAIYFWGKNKATKALK